MKQDPLQKYSWLWPSLTYVAIGSTLFSVFPSMRVNGQIIPDNTLGAEQSVVTPISPNRDRIDGGATRDTNLFHSFEQFSVGTGREAYYSNPNGITNIFSRVTGNSRSDILGRLGVLGDANLFLINPNGILFGPNATLDLRGAFHASTANEIIFPDGKTFSALTPNAAPLLTVGVTVPFGVEFAGAVSGDPVGDLTNEAVLAVNVGQRLTLQGNTVISRGDLLAPGGTIQVLGNRVGLVDQAQIDVSSPTSAGTVQVGGAFQGNDSLMAAARTYVAEGVEIAADALTSGDGGEVIVWADEVTGFYGTVTARGGSNTGNGGFVEVSGKETLLLEGNVDVSATNGLFGTLLLDPETIIISNEPSDPNTAAAELPDIFANNFSDQIVTINAQDLMDQQGNIQLEADGEIRIFAALNFPGSLTLTSGNNRIIGGAVSIQSVSDITLNSKLDASNDVNLNSFNGNIVTQEIEGQNITLSAPLGNIRSGFIDAGEGGNASNVNINAGFDVDINRLDSDDAPIQVISTDGTITIPSISSGGGDDDSGSITLIANNGSINIGKVVTVPNDEISSINSNSGDVFIRAKNNIIFDFIDAQNEEGDDAGNVELLSENGSILTENTISENSTGIFTSSRASNNILSFNSTSDPAGNVKITAENGNVSLPRIETMSEDSTGGSVNIIAQEINIAGGINTNANIGGDVQLRTLGGGITVSSILSENGDVSLLSNGNITLDEINTQDVNGGTIEITSLFGNVNVDTLNTSANSSFLRPFFGRFLEIPSGNAGDVSVRANGTINIASIEASSSSGIGGTIRLVSGTERSSDIEDGIAVNSINTSGSPAIDASGGFITATTVNGDLTIADRTVSTGGNITLLSGKNLIIGSAGVGTLTSGGGDIRLETENNGNLIVNGLIDSTNTSSIAGNITLDADGTIILDDIIDAINNVNIAGDVSISNGAGNLILGSIQAGDLDIESSGTIVGNGILTVRGDASFTSRHPESGTVELTNTIDTTISNSIVGGNLTINSSGTVTQEPGTIIQVAGNISGDSNRLNNRDTGGIIGERVILDDGRVIITEVGTVNLEEEIFPSHLTVSSLPRGVDQFGGVLEPAAITLNQANQFAGTVRLNTEIHPDSAVIEAIPGIIQSGPVTIAGEARLNSGGGSIVLTDSGNDFNAIALQSDNVVIADQGGFTFLKSKIDGNLDVITTGVLAQAEPISVIGSTELTTILPEAGHVTLTNVEPTQLDMTLIGGPLTLNALSGASQISGSLLQVAGVIDGVGSSILGDFATSADLPLRLAPTSLNGIQDVVITAVGPIDVSTSLNDLGITTVSGDLTVTSLDRAIEFVDVFEAEAIALADRNRFRGPLRITTDAAVIDRVTGTPDIVQTDAVIVAGTAALRAEGGDITLNRGGNQFDQLSLRANSANLVEQDGTTLLSSTIDGDFRLSSRGNITQSGDLVVIGNTQIASTQTNATIQLTEDNRLEGAIALNTIGNGNVALNTIGGMELGTSQIEGDITLTTSGDIRQSGFITVGGLTTLAAEGVLLHHPNNDFNRVTIEGGDRLVLNDINDLRIRESQIISRDSTSSTIRLRAGGRLGLNGNEFLIRTPTSEGNDIRLNAEEINIRNGNVILSVAAGDGENAGQAGNLVLNADQIRFSDNRPPTLSDEDRNDDANIPNILGSISFSDGQSGDVVIRTHDLIVNDSSIITTATFGSQAGGNIDINADRVAVRGISNEGVLTSVISVDTLGTGAGGTVRINTDQLILEEGGIISASTFSRGAGGNIIIDAHHIEVNGQASRSPNISSGISARSFSRGDGGSIDMTADTITLINTGVIGVSSRRTVGALKDELGAGDRRFRRRVNNVFEELEEIIPEAFSTRRERLRENRVLNGSRGNVPGDAGNVTLTANRIYLDNAEIFARSKAEADGGNITINVTDFLELRFTSAIETQAGRDNAPGNGGDITIDAENGFIFGIREEDSDIVANAFTGNGGNVTITTQEIFGLEFRDERTIWSDITASSTFGQDGEVLINTLNVDLTRGLVPLPDQPVDPDVNNTCRVSGSAEAVEFFMVGQGGSPPTPDNILEAPDLLTDRFMNDDREQAWVPLDTVAADTTNAGSMAATTTGGGGMGAGFSSDTGSTGSTGGASGDTGGGGTGAGTPPNNNDAVNGSAHRSILDNADLTFANFTFGKDTYRFEQIVPLCQSSAQISQQDFTLQQISKQTLQEGDR